MLKLKKNDKISLLKVLLELVTANIEAGEVELFNDRDIQEFILSITDKRYIRELKKIKKELDNFIKEMEIEQKLKKKEQSIKEFKNINENIFSGAD
jgi:hypothetical protein